MEKNTLSEDVPSILKTKDAFIDQLDVTQKTKDRYSEIIWLFLESLQYAHPELVKETESGEFVFTGSWHDFYGGAINTFLDYWLQRKVLAPDDLIKRAPGVLKKFIQWSYEQGHFDKEHYEDYLEALPQGKSKELSRLQKLGELFYKLHSPVPGQWMTKQKSNVQTINSSRKQPDKIEEGYMEVKSKSASACVVDFEGEEIGPIQLSPEITKLLKKGDVVNLVIGRYDGHWQVLESGNVYPEGTIY